MPAPLPLTALDGLPPALRHSTVGLLGRFEAALAKAGIDAIPANVVEHLARVFACSPFTADVATSAPGDWLASLALPDRAREAERYRERVAMLLEGNHDEAELRARVRRFRKLETAALCWLDVLGLASLDTVLAALSALADALVDGAAAWLHADLAARYGEPGDEANEPVSLVVIAMGKLGGRELNFSSDIDLIFCFRSGGDTRGGTRTVSNQEFFDRLGKRLIAFLNDVTPDGFVYRVDMRLRPFGESGALTASFSALEQYYQLHGRDWERYALIKARVIHGSAGDVAALEDIRRPFIYRRYLDFGAIESLRGMKAMIDAEATREGGLKRDVKRGAGGIREVEFIGQALQLVRGGRESRLRRAPIQPVLETCGELGLLDGEDVRALLAAYRFLRTTEHRLQQVHDAQTQTLPTDAIEQARIAFGMGHADWPGFEQDLDRHRAAVRERFEGLLMPQRSPGAESNAAAERCVELWRAPADSATLEDSLRQAGFMEHAGAAATLASLKSSRFLARLSSAARDRLDRLMPQLLAECAGHPAGAVVLARVAELLHAVAGRSVYLALLADNPLPLAQLVALCAQSSWMASQIARWPILLDELLDHRLFTAPPNGAQLQRLLARALAGVPAGDLEQRMEVLRNFKHQQVLRVAACDLLAGSPVSDVSNHLTSIAERLIDCALNWAWSDLVARHGRPAGVRKGRGHRAGFAIIAYGKLGGRELGYSSDLDLVFVHDTSSANAETDGLRPIPNDVFFTRLAKRLIHFLTTRTAAGFAYELDLRLRPSGASGLLVTSLEAFAEYQTQRAWTWEHQALLRARGVAGSLDLLGRFNEVRRHVLRQPRDLAKLRQDILEMRERMRAQLDRSDATHFDLKQGVGGITDIEFMVQYLCLRWAPLHQILTAYTDNLRLLDLLRDLALMPREDCRVLHAAYFAYRAEVHRCALQEVDGLVAATALEAQRKAVAAVWQRLMFE